MKAIERKVLFVKDKNGLVASTKPPQYELKYRSLPHADPSARHGLELSDSKQ